jgi:hypothetical protein
MERSGTPQSPTPRQQSWRGGSALLDDFSKLDYNDGQVQDYSKIKVLSGFVQKN